MNKNTKQLEILTEELMAKIGFEELDISASKKEDIYYLQIDSSPQDAGLLIGYHGENILALQYIIGQLYNSQRKEWTPVALNIGDYREKRKQSLISMAENAAQRVKLLKKPITLPYLSGNERRIVHLALSEDDQVETFSEGEGSQRRLTIKSKNEDSSDLDDQLTEEESKN